MKAKTYSFVSDSVDYEIVETKKGKEYFVKGYISTYQIDLVNDIVTPECMKDMLDQLQNRAIKIDLEHESFLGDTHLEKEVAKTKIPIGKIVEGHLDDTGLFVKVKVNSNHSRFKEAWKSMVEGFLDAFSIAFIPIKTVTKEVDGVIANLIDKVRLLNVAFTGNPCNTTATMRSVFMKSLDDIKQGEITMANVKVKEDPVEPPKDVPTEPATKDGESDEGKDKVIDAELISVKSELEVLKTQVAELLKAKKPKPKKDDDEDEDKDKVSKKAEEIETLKTEVSELKAILDKPQYKAITENMDSTIQKNVKKKSVVGPIDYID